MKAPLQILFALLLFVPPRTEATGQEPNKASTLAGRVFRSDLPAAQFADVAVTLRLAAKDIPEKKRVIAEVKTDVKSGYTFSAIAPGAYTLHARVVFKSDGEAPCPVVSTGLNLFPEYNADGWSVHMIRTNVGVIQGITSNEFSVAAGQSLRRDIDLKCK